MDSSIWVQEPWEQVLTSSLDEESYTECKMVQPLWKSGVSPYLPYDPAIALPGISRKLMAT